jgi:chemotaxis signal transduction protein
VEDVPSLVDTEVPEHYIKGVGKLKDRLLVLLDLNKILTPEEFQHVERHIKTVSKE